MRARATTHSQWPSMAVLGLAALFAVSTVRAQERLAVHAGRVITGTGADVLGAVILVEGGRIKAIGAGLEVPRGWREIDRRDAVVAPGLIDVCSFASAPRDLTEDADVIDVRSRTATALDLEHRDFALLRRFGVTSVVILPRPENVVAGVGCVVKTAGEAGRVLRVDGPLEFSLDADVYGAGRFPTSLVGAVQALESALESALGPDAPPALRDVVAGRARAVAWADDEGALEAVIRIRKKRGLDLSVLGAASLRRLLADLEGTALRVGMRPISFASPRRDLLLPAHAEKVGLDVAFFAETPSGSPEVLRLAAALAHRYGLSREAAIASITRIPAEMAQVADRIGTLAPGRHADFVVLEGDLLDLQHAVRETWIDGRRAYAAEITKGER